MDPFHLGSRARNMENLGGDLGDPERWGSYVTWDVPISTGVDTGYVPGQQAVRVQFDDLRARGLDVLAAYRIDGIEALDGPFQAEPDGFTGFGLQWILGVGQASVMMRNAAVLAVNTGAWSHVTERGHVVEGVMQIQTPAPGVSLNITPVFRLKTGTAAPHTLTIRTYVFACPRSSP